MSKNFIVAVYVGFGRILIEILHDFFPIDKSWSDKVDQLEEDQSIVQVGVQILHLGTHTQRIHPVSVHYRNKVIIAFLNGLSFYKYIHHPHTTHMLNCARGVP